MTTPGPAVRLATSEDAEAIADLLADAFLDYEWSRWAVPADDRRERLRGLHRLYAGPPSLCAWASRPPATEPHLDGALRVWVLVRPAQR